MTCDVTRAEDFDDNHIAGEANVPDITYPMCVPGCHPAFTSGQYDAGVNLSHRDGPHGRPDVLWGMVWGTFETLAVALRRACGSPEFRRRAELEERIAFGFGRVFNVLTPPAERLLRAVPDPFGRDRRNRKYPGRGRVRAVRSREKTRFTRNDRVRLTRLLRTIARTLRYATALFPLPQEGGPWVKKLRRLEETADTIIDRLADLAGTMTVDPWWIIAQHEPFIAGLLRVRTERDFEALLPAGFRFLVVSDALLDFMLDLGSCKDAAAARAIADGLDQRLAEAEAKAARILAEIELGEAS